MAVRRPIGFQRGGSLSENIRDGIHSKGKIMKRWILGLAALMVLVNAGQVQASAGNDVVPEPSTVVIWSVLAALGVAYTWCRRKR